MSETTTQLLSLGECSSGQLEQAALDFTTTSRRATIASRLASENSEDVVYLQRPDWAAAYLSRLMTDRKKLRQVTYLIHGQVFDDERDQQAIGLARIRVHDETTVERPKGGIQLSYWLGLDPSVAFRDNSTEIRVQLGVDIIGKLIENVIFGAVAEELSLPTGQADDDGTPTPAPEEYFWMVLIPSDKVTERAASLRDFRPSGPQQPYFLGDGVRADRQLWLRTMKLELPALDSHDLFL